MSLLPPAILNPIMPRLRDGYAVGTRYYHTLDHATGVYSNLVELHKFIGIAQPHETGLAALYHDIVYVPGDSTNEDQSALKMYRDAVDLDLFRLVIPDRVAHLIWLTKFHFKPGMEEVLTGDLDAQLLLDSDIAGFAAPWPTFFAQNQALALEFSVAFPKRGSFLKGRIEFLNMVAGSKYIFNSDYYREVHEKAARDNISSLVAVLEKECDSL